MCGVLEAAPAAAAGAGAPAPPRPLQHVKSCFQNVSSCRSFKGCHLLLQQQLVRLRRRAHGGGRGAIHVLLRRRRRRRLLLLSRLRGLPLRHGSKLLHRAICSEFRMPLIFHVVSHTD